MEVAVDVDLIDAVSFSGRALTLGRGFGIIAAVIGCVDMVIGLVSRWCCSEICAVCVGVVWTRCDLVVDRVRVRDE